MPFGVAVTVELLPFTIAGLSVLGCHEDEDLCLVNPMPKPTLKATNRTINDRSMIFWRTGRRCHHPLPSENNILFG